MLLKAWSPIHLDNMLKQWFWKEDVISLNTQDLWQKMCDYLYLPRLLDSSILQVTVSNGVVSGDYFGYADGKNGDDYFGFRFKEPVACVIDKSIPDYRVRCSPNVQSQERTAGSAAGRDR